MASKMRLCSVPFTGDMVFGPELDWKGQRIKREPFPKKFFSSFKKKPQKGIRSSDQRSLGQNRKVKGRELFSLPIPVRTQNRSDVRLPVGGRLKGFSHNGRR